MDECIRNLKKASGLRAIKSKTSPTYQATKALSKGAMVVSVPVASAATAGAAIENSTATVAPAAEQQPPPTEAPVPTEVPEQIRELRKMYLYGLMIVSELDELQNAPDAILYGNFCGTGATEGTGGPPPKE